MAPLRALWSWGVIAPRYAPLRALAWGYDCLALRAMSLRDGIVLPDNDNIGLEEASHLASSRLFDNSKSLPLGEVAEAAVTGGLLIHHWNAISAETDDETIRQFDFDDEGLASHGV